MCITNLPEHWCRGCGRPITQDELPHCLHYARAPQGTSPTWCPECKDRVLAYRRAPRPAQRILHHASCILRTLTKGLRELAKPLGW